MPTTGPPLGSCARLPMEQVDEWFYLEGAPPTRAWPRLDVHYRARLLCSACPILAECAASSFSDPHTFRGGLAPEERAAFGGPLPRMAAKRRDPLIPRTVVWERVVNSPLPDDVMARVLSEQAARHGGVRIKGSQDEWVPPAA